MSCDEVQLSIKYISFQIDINDLVMKYLSGITNQVNLLLF